MLIKVEMRKFIFTLISLLSGLAIYAQNTAFWTYSQKNNDDGTISLIFKAEIEKPWYMYNTTLIENGPLPTTFEVKQSGSFTVVSPLK